VLLAVVLTAGGCTRYASTRPSAEPATGAACLAALAERGIEAGSWPAPTGGACRVEAPVVASGGGLRLAPDVRTSCGLLLAWAGFEPEIDRLAREIRGAGLRAVQHHGSHACRRMTGNSGRFSLHASARAIDIAAFELTNGERITVSQHWHGRGQQGRFIRAVAKAACVHFSTVLTPRTDRWHRDHLHLDIGPWKTCDA
jgi:hypothetical protein